jgi:hypothetical protein
VGVNSATSLASAGAQFGAPAPVAPAKKTRKRAKKPAGEEGLLARLATPEVLGAGAAVGLAAVFVALVAGSLRPPSMS